LEAVAYIAALLMLMMTIIVGRGSSRQGHVGLGQRAELVFIGIEILPPKNPVRSPP